LDNRRQVVSGVSSDEELTNMIMFQQGYNAASRYINVVSDMLDTLINRVGR
jgi:flagellar hook-associated protein 1 FlgK